MQVRAVLFDIDGTLVDSNEQHVSAWVLAFREAGYPQEPSAVREQIGKGGDLLVPALLPDVDEVTAKRIADAHGKHFKEMYLDHVPPFPGASALIARVYEAGIKVVLASSAKRGELDHYVALLGVGDLLAGTTSADDVDASKPEPDIFSAALAKLGEPGHAAIVVGDTPYDIEAARKAGVRAIGLLSGPFDTARLTQAGAIAVYCDVADLLDQLDRSPIFAS